ncbi:MAG: NAD-dependent epimerase/dehydratase family protein [Rhizobiales bacterium]|nr:NAD-dependent epimerase/dehydratase family protein [Hyphomicrobiales bacterium]
MAGKTALVTGITGVVGYRIAAHLASLGGWRVIGVSRRVPAESRRVVGVDYVPLDLTDPAACAKTIGGLSGVTHFFNAARFEHTTTQPEPIDINTRMFVDVLDALEAGGHPLRHVHLVQGTKYYGSTAGRFPTPARENDPRSLHDTFYFTQEDIAIERAKTRAWTWSASRPHGICDPAPDIVRSMARLIGVYAAICKELDRPLCFPGTPENYRAVYQCTDSSLLAKAIVWMSTDPSCGNQAFNVTNGEYFRWENLWPRIADYLGMRCGPVVTLKLANAMADKADVWNRIVARHGLRDIPYADAAIWTYGDFLFTPAWDMMSSTTKLRQFGFPDVIDTEAMFFKLFDALRRERVIPAA